MKSEVKPFLLKAVAFLSSNPTATSNINPGRELREIRKALEGVESFRLFDETGINEESLIDLIADINDEELPLHMLHLCMHGKRRGGAITEEGIMKYDHIVTHLCDLKVKEKITCVVVNACYSSSSVSSFKSIANHLIVMEKAQSADMGIFFSEKFYRQIKRGKKISTAYDSACKQLKTAIKENKFINPETRKPYEYRDDFIPKHIPTEEEEKYREKLTAEQEDGAYRSLLSFNFSKQSSEFSKTIHESIPICLIHGEYEHGQDWLFNKLLENWPDLVTSKPLKLEPSSSIRDLNHLLRVFKKYFLIQPKSNGVEAFKEALQNSILKKLQTESFIIQMKNPSRLGDEAFMKFIELIWLPTLQFINQSQSFRENNHRLLLFLVEMEQVITQESYIISAIPDKFINVLTPNQPIVYEDFNDWVDLNSTNSWVYKMYYPHRTPEKFERMVNESNSEFCSLREQGIIKALPEPFLYHLFSPYLNKCRY